MGRSRGGLTSKLHALVDADGRPVSLRLTDGQVHDACEAEALIEERGQLCWATRGMTATPSARPLRLATSGLV
ncbi:transposase [Sphingobium yanoikuyae]|uniref:transposase n=1 Tax=Sphingobium yanoikuyae TaxID=13690 RepID=UPI003B912204